MLLLFGLSLSAAWTLYFGVQTADAYREYRRAKARLHRITLGGGPDMAVWLTRQSIAYGMSGPFSDGRH